MKTKGKKKSGVKAADLMKTLTEVKAKNAELTQKADAIAKSPNYGGTNRTRGLLLGGTPPNHTKQLGERLYSFTKMAAYSKGQIPADRAVEEVQISQKLMAAYESLGFTPHAGAFSMLVPTCLAYLPRHNDAAEKLAVEIGQKMALNIDPGELAYVAKQAGISTKALGTLSDLAGGAFVPGPQILEILDMQRNFEAFARAGASEIPMMPNGRAFISKLSSGATAYWVGEGQAIAASQATTGQMLLQAKKLGVLVPINNELLRFGAPASEGLFRNDMARVAALKADAAMFAGTGGTQIKGLLTYDSQASWVQGVDKYIAYTVAAAQQGADGDTLQPQDIDMMVGALPDEVDEPKFLLRRKLLTALNSRRAAAISDNDNAGTFVNQRVMGISGKITQMVNGYEAIYSSNVPNNRTKGSGTDLTTVIAGRFPDWVIARLGVMEVLLNGFADSYFPNDMTALRGIQHIDAGPRYLASFVVADQLIEA